MSSSARILAFPVARARPVPLDSGAARQVAERCLRDASSVPAEGFICDPDFLLVLLTVLRERTEADPRGVSAVSEKFFSLVESSERPVGVFDERDYFLGELCLIHARTLRLLGKLRESESWLDRADSFFRHTLHPAPHLSNVAYARLALRYDQRELTPVLEQTPALAASFQKLGMAVESAKTVFLRCMTLKVAGRREEAHELMLGLMTAEALLSQPALHGQCWTEIGEYRAACDDFVGATRAYQEALALLSHVDRPIAVYGLKLSLGEALRSQGLPAQALQTFRSAVSDAEALSLSVSVAYARLLTAETLLDLGRRHEAEWEVRAALPTIEEQSLVAEGVAALSILQESVARRSTDPKAIQGLRRFLQ